MANACRRGKAAPTRRRSIWNEKSGQRLQRLAKSTGRSRAYLAAEAIHEYLDVNEWQVAGIEQAIASLDRGRGIAHTRVSEWISSWETRKERPAPKKV
jgi:RHH-type rel operon transcriptional repressor/antitoxin RelB